MSDIQKANANHPLIVFGEDWGGHPSSTQHLIQRLGEDRKVVWVNSIGLRRPRLTDLGRVINKVRAMMRSNPESSSGSVAATLDSVVSPRAISWPGNRLAAAFNRRSLPKQIKPILKRLDHKRPILWTSLPSAVEAIGTMDELAVVYYAGDDFSALAGVDHRPVARQEARLAEIADIIIAASDKIAQRFPRGKTFVLPHGVDYDLFTKPTARADDLPNDGRPVAGFYGAIDDWFHTQMLAETAARMPDWHFALIGPVRTDVTALRTLENVHFLGPRPHHMLPAYSQHWTASLIPFLDNEQIKACNPLKLREYMAAGRPIVATDFPAAKPFADFIRSADTSETFETQLRDIAESGDDLCAGRREAVKNQSWDARAREVGILIEALQNGTNASI